MRVALVNAPLQSAVCDHGVGHQMPLGLLMIGGALRDRCEVALIDAAREHLPESRIARRVIDWNADVVMIAHVGSTQAHPCCLRTLAAIKAADPHITTVYGGVHPTYHAEAILESHPEVDLVVRGEGEATVVELIAALESRDERNLALARISGIAWRQGGEVRLNPPRETLVDLDTYPIAWDLIEDWDRYQAFGLGRAAVAQFSRGCPHTCTYCGQWMFWRKWRHRNVTRFVDELEWLRRKRDVRFIWIADENPTTLPDVWKRVLEEIARRDLGLGLCASIRAQDIVRDADFLHLYREAGFLYVLMGVETVTDDTLAKIRKGSNVNDAYQAVRLLRRHGILSIVDYIFGLEEETPRTLLRALKGLLRYDGDFVNALYVTPHSWTPLGRAMSGAPIIEPDLSRWDYRHQVVGVKHLTPAQLFLGVKLIEWLYHLHPRRLGRILAARDARSRRQLRHCVGPITAVFWYEVFEALGRALFRGRSRSTTPFATRPPSGRPEVETASI